MRPLRAESLSPKAPASKLFRPVEPAALGPVFPVQHSWSGESGLGLDPSRPGEKFCSCKHPPPLGLLGVGGGDLDSTTCPRFLPICVCFLLYIFSCGKSCFIFLGSFSSIIGFK